MCVNPNLPVHLTPLGVHTLFSMSVFLLIRSSIQFFWGFPGSSDSEESACNERDLGSILGQEDPLEKGMVT